ncbi:DNA-directed DNA polymerase, family B, exonuclease domain protein, partial [mine drainage metagenome]
TICGVAEGGGRPPRTFRLADDRERTILERFVEVVEQDDPDVLTGYNIGGYDFPLLLERAKEVGLGDLRLGRDRSPPAELGERLWKIHGR